jgi:hypothetical protein
MRPVALYLLLALVLNVIIDTIMYLNTLKEGIRFSNNPIYNIHSVVRFALFSYFFLLNNISPSRQLVKWLIALFFAGALVNFTFYEKFFNFQSFSDKMFTAESFILLALCMMYYLAVMRNEKASISERADFWVVTGLAIYNTVNFFVFLFYQVMLAQDTQLALRMWNVHNIAYIILCIFIAKALYAPAGNRS